MKRIILLSLLICSTSFAEETYRVQVVTKTFVPELGHEYRDAQYFDISSNMTLDEFKASKESEIKAEEAKRIAARIEEKNNPPVYVEPSKEELEEAKAQLVAQIADLDAKIVTAKPKDEKVVAEEVIV